MTSPDAIRGDIARLEQELADLQRRQSAGLADLIASKIRRLEELRSSLP